MQKVNLKEVIEKGAIIIDVRTKEEFMQEHGAGSINVPLDELPGAMEWLIKDVPAIVCCASGTRSAMAKMILEANGFKEVYNGGPWNSLGEYGAGGACPVK